MLFTDFEVEIFMGKTKVILLLKLLKIPIVHKCMDSRVQKCAFNTCTYRQVQSLVDLLYFPLRLIFVTKT